MKTNRNIYFAAAITGGRMNQPHYAEIVEILEQYGTVFSKHVADKSLGEYGETDIGKEEIHARELERLTQSDIIVAEVTTSSLGVGYLIAQAVSQHKKVIAIYNGEDSMKLTAMIAGDKNIDVRLYKTKEDLVRIFDTTLNP